GLRMLGWGRPENVVRGVATPLYARAMVLFDRRSGTRFAYVCADLNFIPELVRRGVLDRLRERHGGLDFAPRDLMLGATHTHSGPAGYTQQLPYMLAAPGISLTVLDAIVAGLADAIAEAAHAAQPCRLWLCSGTMPLVRAAAFNRSLAAYNSNADV